jgi:hypothetical protein
MPRPERRNLYRLLHVQPEAPAAVLKASYRALMSTLRGHPDLGGDPDQAAELNAAYAVLSDPRRRAQYDQSLRRRLPWRGAAAAAATPGDPLRWRDERRCPFCGAATGTPTPRQPRCAACDSPLTPAPRADLAERERIGRRRGERYVRPQDAVVRLSRTSVPLPARVRDLSMGGLSLLLRAPLRAGQPFRVTAAGFDAVAQAVAVRPQGTRSAVHARLLSLQVLRQPRGTLIDDEV